MAVGAAALAAVAGVLAGAVGLLAGARSLPVLYLVAGAVAGVAAARSRRVVTCAVAAGVVGVVGLTDLAARRAVAPPGHAGRVWIDPSGVAWIPLPEGWIENVTARADLGDHHVRQYAPVGADPDTAPHLQCAVDRTGNDGRAQREARAGLELIHDVRRGGATGHRWRIVEHGMGEVGIELHDGAWRITVYVRAGLESRTGEQAFEALRPLGEAICDRVQLAPRTCFDRWDRAWFGR